MSDSENHDAEIAYLEQARNSGLTSMSVDGTTVSYDQVWIDKRLNELYRLRDTGRRTRRRLFPINLSNCW